MFDCDDGLVQALLDQKANGELLVQFRRKPNLSATQLLEKHFPSSVCPRCGVCRACG